LTILINIVAFPLDPSSDFDPECTGVDENQSLVINRPVLAGLKMFGSEKLKFQVLRDFSHPCRTIHPLRAMLENALSGKNQIKTRLRYPFSDCSYF
jgi:hypothetical protein